MSDEIKNPEAGVETVEEVVEATEKEVDPDLLNIACRVPQRDGSKGCGGMQAKRLAIPNGPTFYVCQSCNGRWMPVNAGGAFPY